jgi:hypothetical protein
MRDAPPEAGWPLGPRSARVLYNVADAWSDGASARSDPVAALAAPLADAKLRRRVERTLWLVEWSPRLALHSTRGFSWLDRAARRAWLERLSAKAPRRFRAALSELLTLLRYSDPPGP